MNKVYNLVKKIKKGKVTSYKQLAKLTGLHPRAVARILSQNKNKQVPCHRIVMASGNLGGYNKGIKLKIKKLKSEGIIIKNNKISKEFFQTF